MKRISINGKGDIMIMLRSFDEAYLNDLSKSSSQKVIIRDENITDFLNNQGVDLDVSKWREGKRVSKKKTS